MFGIVFRICQLSRREKRVFDWLNLNSFSQRYISEQTGDVEGTEKAIIWTGPKLGNAPPPPPEIIFRGPLKFFSWMVIQKREPRRGNTKLEWSGGMPPQKILRNLTLFWRLFKRFEPLKFLSFSKV